MNAFAWAKDMRTATMMREFVTSKPVMVQPNLPRFLRVGDEARLLATVYNNSDSTAEVTTVVEIFDIASDEVISTFKSVDNIAASASAIVAATVSAPGNAASIGYRVRSTIGRFTDGEQNFIPIKASESDVIESENFYLNPGEASVSIDIPKGKGMESTLDYTANPAWNIIKELPGISTGKPTTSTGAARRLFAAATAAGLLRSYPDLAKAIDEWSADPDAGALTSRLAKNDALKAAILNSLGSGRCRRHRAHGTPVDAVRQKSHCSRHPVVDRNPEKATMRRRRLVVGRVGPEFLSMDHQCDTPGSRTLEFHRLPA